jgi:hypothetical protein
MARFAQRGDRNGQVARANEHMLSDGELRDDDMQNENACSDNFFTRTWGGTQPSGSNSEAPPVQVNMICRWSPADVSADASSAVASRASSTPAAE